jgi:hypothetical protein
MTVDRKIISTFTDTLPFSQTYPLDKLYTSLRLPQYQLIDSSSSRRDMTQFITLSNKFNPLLIQKMVYNFIPQVIQSKMIIICVISQAEKDCMQEVEK